MKVKSRQSGLTLTEMTVVIAVVALLVGLGLPSVRVFLNTFESQGGARPMISAALASARAIAAKEQRYAGVRFQQDLAGSQYMVFIVHDFDKTGLASGFRAVEGLQPVRLPENLGVMDLSLIAADIDIDVETELNNATAFSIIFSPSGKLVIHDVQVRNRDGSVDGANNFVSSDDVFNKKLQVDAGIAMFYQDDYFGANWSPYPDLGFGPEPSRRSFVIYEKDKFRQAYEKGQAYSGYLLQVIPEAIYINPYTGTMIER